MEIVLIIGRVLFAFLFVASGIGHFAKLEGMAGYAASKGVPAAKAATLISGAMAVVGGLLVAVGFYQDLGALLLAAFVLPTAVLMHPYWKETDPMAKMNEQIAFNKDVALGGAALIVLALSHATGPASNLLF